jgi:plastocyanin
MKTLIAVIVALIVVGGGWYYYSQSMVPASVSQNTATNADSGGDYTPPADEAGAGAADGVSGGVSADIDAGIVTSAPMSATVALTSSGPSPKSVTIKKGGTVTWVNQTGGAMWIASAPHPTHTGYDGTTEQTHCAAGYTGPAPFDECKEANTFSFTFNKVGSWSYHNHENASLFGTVVVVE